MKLIMQPRQQSPSRGVSLERCVLNLLAKDTNALSTDVHRIAPTPPCHLSVHHYLFDTCPYLAQVHQLMWGAQVA